MTDKTELKKSITWLQGSAIATGSVIGAGILALPALSAVTAGPAALISWVLMGLVSLPMLVVVAGMSSRYPDSGGIAAYARRAFGSGMGRLTGFLVIFALPLVAPATLLIGANYLGNVFGWPIGAVHLCAAAMAVLAVFLNCRGIDVSGRTQVVVVALIISMLFFIFMSALPYIHLQKLYPFAPAGFLSVGKAMPMLFFAFIGWEMIGHLAEEFQNPRHDIPVSLATAFVIDNMLYLAVVFAVVGSGVYKIGNPNVAMMTLVGWRWGETAAILIGLLGCVVCFCPILTSVAGWSRLAYALARDGVLPGYLASLHREHATPCAALLTLALVLCGILLLSWTMALDLTSLLSVASATFLLAYMIGMFAAARVLPTKVGRCAGLLGGLSSLFIFLMAGRYVLFPLAVSGYFAVRYRNEFKWEN